MRVALAEACAGNAGAEEPPKTSCRESIAHSWHIHAPGHALPTCLSICLWNVGKSVAKLWSYLEAAFECNSQSFNSVLTMKMTHLVEM